MPWHEHVTKVRLVERLSDGAQPNGVNEGEACDGDEELSNHIQVSSRLERSVEEIEGSGGKFSVNRLFALSTDEKMGEHLYTYINPTNPRHLDHIEQTLEQDGLLVLPMQSNWVFACDATSRRGFHKMH